MSVGRRLVWGLVLAGIAVASPAAAQSPVEVEADRIEYEQEGRVLRAEGGVVVEWNDNRLQAERITVEQQARRLSASGAVSLTSPEASIECESVELAIDEETGVLTDVDVSIAGEHGGFGGSRAEKLAGHHYVLEDGYYTTCERREGREPDWELTGDKVDVELERYGTIRSGALRVRGVPVLYVPYIAFPTKATRASGFLLPHLGSSDKRGFIYTQPYYWAIDKHSDLTVSSEIETSARLGVTGEYRYRPSHSRSGRIEGSYYNEAIRGNPESEIVSPSLAGRDIPLNRGFLELNHRETFSRASNGLDRGLDGYADVLVVSDDLFLREIDSVETGNPAEENRRVRRYTNSRAGLAGYRGDLSYGVEADAYQDFFGRDRYTLQKPGSAWVAGDGKLATFNYDVQGALSSFVRERGADGQRLGVGSTVELPIRAVDVLASRAWIGGHGAVYQMDDRTQFGPADPDGVRLPAVELDHTPGLAVVEAGADTRTKLARTYAMSGERWTALTHTVEPFVAVRSIEATSDDDVPLYDRLDSVDTRTVGSYGFDSRFLVRRSEGGALAEVARVSLAHAYNFTDVVLDDHFSDIDLAAFVRPVEGLALRTLTSYNVGASKLTGAHASLGYETGPVGWFEGPRTAVALAYRYVSSEFFDLVEDASAATSASRGTSEPEFLSGLESAEAAALIGLTRRFDVGFGARFDFESDRFVEKGAGIRFRAACDCWTIDFGAIERVNPDELQFRILVELKGLSSVGSSGVERRTRALEDVHYDAPGFWRPGW